MLARAINGHGGRPVAIAALGQTSAARGLHGGTCAGIRTGKNQRGERQQNGNAD
jgi:hypothetical protein